MIMSLSPSPLLAVSLPELKVHLRIEHDLEDVLLATLVRTATESAEMYLGQVLLQRGFEQRWELSATVGQKILRVPLVQIQSVVLDGLALVASEYSVTTNARDEKCLEIATPGSGEIRIQYLAGSAVDWNGIPEGIRFGILRYASHLYVNRDNDRTSAIPSAALALWQPYRKMRLS
jgi:uncharacterized phiE125 gp8 family phage protein